MSAQAIIEELLEYFEDRADASMEPGDDRFRGNKEMALLAEVQKLAGFFSEGNGFTLAARTADTLDAERYRYLRNIAGQYGDDTDGPMVCDGLGDNFEFLRGEEVDASVDAAMALWKAAGCPLPKETTK